MNDATHLTPYRFRISVPEGELEDLQRRLRATRWPIAPVAEPWRYGTDPAWLRRVIDYWLDGFNWRAQERRLNKLDQYRIPLDGLAIHLVVERGSGSAPAPLLLLNGWPSTFAEFAHVIEPIAHPERFGGNADDGFTVIVPSYPGFGFSEAPPEPIGARHVAALLTKLMIQVVGSSRYFIHGADWGAIIGSWMAYDAPDQVIALHLNTPALRQPLQRLTLTPAEQSYLDERARLLANETGYQAIQSTRPQSLAYGLTDSPVGLAGWILEKYRAWAIPDVDGDPPFPLDELLTTVMIYWLNGINAANWLYCDLDRAKAVTLPADRRVEVPTALFVGTGDLAPIPPECWVQRSYRLEHLHVEPGAGHFPFMEASGRSQIEHIRHFFGAYAKPPVSMNSAVIQDLAIVPPGAAPRAATIKRPTTSRTIS